MRIILAASDFGKELTSDVLWLNERDLDIRCVRMRPYTDGSRTFLDVQQVIPLPEAEEFQLRFREKARSERKARESNADFTRYDVTVGGESFIGLPKRSAIYQVVGHLVETGHAPEDITARALARGFERTWVVVDGHLEEDAFHPVAAAARTAAGRAYDPARWFNADSELLHHDQRTYAFSKMWGGEKWRTAMEALKEGHPEAKIDLSATRVGG